jgi:hypothetical protein
MQSILHVNFKPGKPIKQVIKSLFFIIASVFALIGLIFLLAAMHGYSLGDTADAVPFIQITFALSCLCFPLAVFFIYRTRKSFRSLKSAYDIPEPPSRSTFFLILAIGFSAATLIFSILCILAIAH